MDDAGVKYIPTEDEIRRVCEEEIQPAWNEKEKLKRAGTNRPKGWKVPAVRLTDLPDEVRGWVDSINKEDGSDHKSDATLER